MISLEKNLEQLNLMYHQLVTQKSEQKISAIVKNLIKKGYGEKNEEKE